MIQIGETSAQCTINAQNSKKPGDNASKNHFYVNNQFQLNTCYSYIYVPSSVSAETAEQTMTERIWV